MPATQRNRMNPPPEPPVTLGELGRKVDDLATTMKELAQRVDERPSWQDVRRIERGWEERLAGAVKQREIVTRSQEHRINDLQAWQTWAGRLFMGGVASSIIGAYFVLRP